MFVPRTSFILVLIVKRMYSKRLCFGWLKAKEKVKKVLGKCQDSFETNAKRSTNQLQRDSIDLKTTFKKSSSNQLLGPRLTCSHSRLSLKQILFSLVRQLHTFGQSLGAKTRKVKRPRPLGIFCLKKPNRKRDVFVFVFLTTRISWRLINTFRFMFKPSGNGTYPLAPEPPP